MGETMRKGLLLAGVVVVLGGAAFGLMHWRAAADTPAPAQAQAPVQQRAVPVVTKEAVQGDFPIRRRTIGRIESPATVVVKARIDSKVMEQKVTDGQMVKAGDVLFTLDDGEIRAAIARDQAMIAKDEAMLAQASADLERMQALIGKNAVSHAQVDLAVATAKSAEATLAGDKASLQTDELKLGYTILTAPISGRIGAVRVSPGNLVKANDDASSLVTITQMDPLRVVFTLPERDFSALQAAAGRASAAPVRVFHPGEHEALATGKLDFIDSTVDTASGTIMAKAALANADLKLWPGQYVDVEIDLSTMPNVVRIPTVAVQQGQDGPYVFVVKPDQTAAVANIKTIGTIDDVTGLSAGVAAGQRVVTEGQLQLTNGVKVRDATKPAGGTEAKS
jgi:multidrug efflux system membrane fusion protein